MQLSECRVALLAGLLLMLAPLGGMLFFNDDATLGKASEAVTYDGPPTVGHSALLSGGRLPHLCYLL